MLIRIAPLIGALLLVATSAPAQRPDTVSAPALPGEVADQIVDYLNDPDHFRFDGPHEIAAGDTVRGDVAVLGGPLELRGRVEGNLVVVNGDVRSFAGASVTGDVWVVGGEVEDATLGTVLGEVVTYAEPLRYRRRDGVFEVVTAEEADPASWGRSDLLIATGKSYNRVEGLPVIFGPRIQTEGSNPLRVHALAVYRSEAGFRIDTEQMGYYLRVEQFLGGHEAVRVGATAHSLVEPIEDWHLSDLESGLATFLFHRDFRDHYEREGASVFGSWEPEASSLSLTGELRWDRHRSMAAGTPWSLFGNAEPWRPQPLVGEGPARSAVVSGTLDTRNDPDHPSTGWYLRGRLEQSLATSLRRPAAFAATGPTGPYPGPVPVDAEEFGHFTVGTVDLRRYNRVDPRSRLNFRLLLAGPLAGGGLPPQYQHALGGEGSLPGYDLFSRDCSAREAPVYRSAAEASDPTAARFFPRYGCDAVALLQADFRGKLNFRLRWDSAPWQDGPSDEEEWGIGWDFSPDWTVFVDAGRGWSAGPGPDESMAVDVGVGVVVSRLGLYLALPLSGGNGLNAFIRIGPRF